MKGGLKSLAALLASLTVLQADDTAKFVPLLAPAGAHGGVVTIPPGDYELDGATPLPIASRTTVSARGARFHLPAKLGNQARVVLFAGTNVSDFRWFGGHFTGHVFDPAKAVNPSEPNANTRAITFAPGGDTILVADNVFNGPVRDIPPATTSGNMTIRGNIDLEDGRKLPLNRRLKP